MLTVLMVCMWSAVDVPPPAFSAANDELRAYLTEAVENRPDLNARYLEWKAALKKIPQVRSLDDPMLSYKQFVKSQDKLFAIEIEQKFPWFGTLRAKGNKAMAEADATLARFYAERNTLLAEVKRAYFEYALLGESVALIQEQVDILKDVEGLVRSRYSFGMGTEADVYRIEIERDKTQDQLNGLSQSRPAVSAKLAETLARENAPELPWPQSAPLPSAPTEEETVLARIHAANPNLAVSQKMADVWQKQIKLAKQSWYPEFWLAFEYGDMRDQAQNRSRQRTALAADSVRMFLQDSQSMGYGTALGNVNYEWNKYRFLQENEKVKDDYAITLKMSVPIWYPRINAGVQEAKLMEEAAREEKVRTGHELEAAAKQVMFRLRDAQRRYGLYNDSLIPKEKQVYDSLRGSYDAGTAVDFLDLMNSLQALLQFDLEKARAIQDIHIATADLEMLTGGPMDAPTVENPKP